MRPITGVLVLEGPDGAGKTTLGQAIADVVDGLYIHRTYSPDMDIWEHHTEALRIADENAHKQLVVIDRLWPSEHIYGRVFRNGGQYGDWNSRSMDRVLMRMCALYVLCIPNDPQYCVKVHAEKKARGEEMFDTVLDVAVRYKDFHIGSVIRPPSGDYVEQISAFGGMQHRPDYLFYDVMSMGHDMNKVMDRIWKRLISLQKSQYPKALDPLHPNFLGHINRAEYLFVGDRVGDPSGWSRWPFYGKNRSADLLNKTLHSLGFDETRAIWTNANDEDQQLEEIYRTKQKLKVICLGKEAQKTCEKLGIHVYGKVPHPAYAKRFLHEEGYRMLMMGAI